jgi:DNA-binding NarL/FixJ family response regulator
MTSISKLPISPSVAERPISADRDLKSTPLGNRVSKTLTARERDVLGLISQGFSNKNIARTLGISPETVKYHVKHIFVKMTVSTRAAAASRATATLLGAVDVEKSLQEEIGHFSEWAGGSSLRI